MEFIPKLNFSLPSVHREIVEGISRNSGCRPSRVLHGWVLSSKLCHQASEWLLHSDQWSPEANQTSPTVSRPLRAL